MLKWKDEAFERLLESDSAITKCKSLLSYQDTGMGDMSLFNERIFP